MSTLTLKTNAAFSIIATARLSDQYSNRALLKFQANVDDAGLRNCDEVYMTPTQLCELAIFLQAEAMRMMEK